MKAACLDLRGMQPGFKGHFGRGLGRMVERLALEMPKLAGDLPLAGLYNKDLPLPAEEGLAGYPRMPFPEPMSGMKGVGNFLNEHWLNSRALNSQAGLIHYISQFDAPAFPGAPTIVTVPDLIMVRFQRDLSMFNRKTRMLIRLQRKLEHWSALKAKRVIAISEYTGMETVKFYGVDPDKVRVTPLAADERFQPVEDPDHRDRVRKKYGLPPRFFLTVGGFDPRKNLPRLVEAFGRLIDSRRDQGVCLLMAGSTSNAAEVAPVIDAIHKKTPALRAGLLGFVDDEDLPCLYSLAEALMFPSFYEGFGLPVLEAMACGCPVALSKTTSLPEVAGECGCYMDPDDTDSMAEAMAQIINEPGLRDKISREGLEQAAKFSWEKTARLTLDVYEEVLREQQG